MSNSLRDALLNAGVITKEKADKAAGSQRRKAHQSQKQSKKARTAAPDPTSAKARAAQAHTEKVARDKELNRKRDEAKARSELGQRMAEMIKSSAVNDPAAEIPHNFVEGRHVRRLYVTAEQHKALLAGTMAIAPVGKRHYLIDAETMEKVQRMNPEQKLYLFKEEDSQTPAEDDPYAGYEVPDDLMW